MPRFRFSSNLVAALLIGCGLPTESATSLVAIIGTSSNVASPAGTVDVTVTVVNSGTRSELTADPRSYCGFHVFRVFDPNGKEVELPTIPVACSLAIYGPITLAPNQSVTLTGQWTLPSDLPHGLYKLAPKAWSDTGEIPGSPVHVVVQ